MNGHDYQSAGNILAPWMKKLNERRERMEKEGQDGATLPGMEGGGVPIPEENTSRVVGWLTRRPFVVETEGGKKALFTLMVPRTYHKGGERKRRKSFVPIVAWRALAAQVETLGKDSVVLVEGYLQSWSDKEGKNYRLDLSAEMLEVLQRRESPSDERAPKQEAATA